jgi:hypothetical protein
MRLFFATLTLAAFFFSGCSQPTETVPAPAGGGTSGVTDDGGDLDFSAEAPPSSDGAMNQSDAGVRFVADKKLEVPAMMCPFGCYPAVEQALAGVPGVEGVQLAQQPAGTPDGEIRTKVVELKLSSDFDLAQAMDALEAANFKASEIN